MGKKERVRVTYKRSRNVHAGTSDVCMNVGDVKHELMVWVRSDKLKDEETQPVVNITKILLTVEKTTGLKMGRLYIIIHGRNNLPDCMNEKRLWKARVELAGEMEVAS